MVNVEKNLVDIDKLFNWGGSFELKNKLGNVVGVVYIRLAGDTDINKARVLALRASAELRKRLKDTKSDEHVALMPDLEYMNEDNMISYIGAMNTRDFVRQAQRHVNVPIPVEPSSDASTEEQEEYQKKIDSYPSTFGKAVEELATKYEKDFEKTLKKKSKKEELEQMCLNSVIASACDEEMGKVFQDYCVYSGCFKDKKYKIRLVENFSEFQNLPPEIKTQLVEFYNSLDIGAPELKKSQEATQSPPSGQ